jgi:hypothetical protein
MKRIPLTLTLEELKLLASLVSDQLFRRQFIDPKMPGYKGTREDVDLGHALLGRIRSMIDESARLAAAAAIPAERPPKEHEAERTEKAT